MTGPAECAAGGHLLGDWKGHAHRLAVAATPPGSRWRAPVGATPRHLFVPRWWARKDGAWELRDGDGDPARLLAAAYRDWTLVTRVGAAHADHAEPGARTQGPATSSATLPGLLVQMYRHASIGDGCTVLDVGTGTGYGTAVLCARLGQERVTAIDVDPYLNERARQRLDEAGFRPRVITGDATGPLDGEWDRIVATVAVETVPASWLRALRPGGRLATTLAGMAVILTAEKLADGSAAGRIERDRAMFMRTRSGADYPPCDPALFERACADEGEHVGPGGYPMVPDVMEAWDVRTMLELLAPGIRHHYQEADGARVALMVHDDGSWARAEERDGAVSVHQSGPRRLWSYLDAVRDRWIRDGELPFHGARAAVSPDGVITLTRGAWTATIGGQGT
ncbi:methyltransferase domain-containing protein [Nonomuraea rhizosphaerae]|uniref:methyltransferase domain-containing protein n=1 Tax=Nonomuraea rhizosphaerae TaxID=2665663 RepID=UPI0027E39ED0|nr:methyltransferase domain-containing protein [Nonomuraea rhizosphaerae]